MRGHSANFHIHVSVSELYIPMIDLPILLQEIYMDRSRDFINRSQILYIHECGNCMDCTRARDSQKRNI